MRTQSACLQRLPFPWARIEALLAAAILSATALAQDSTFTFAEDYALAEDRGKVVETLIRGSEAWYDYSCRERLVARDFAEARRLLREWIRAYGRTSRVVETENRLALLSFESDPSATYAFLRERLSLRFDDQREGAGERLDLSTRLDPALISREAWVARARQMHPGSIDGFLDPALFWLAGTELDKDSLHALLARLERPDVPNLSALIVRDLRERSIAGFGSLRVHKLLRVEHLEECLRLEPKLAREKDFVAAWLERLGPNADSAGLDDPAERGAFLARLWAFVGPLPAVHNSLKAHVLYHFLQHDLTAGAPDKQRFQSYIRLPGRTSMVAKSFAERSKRQEGSVDLAQEFPTGMRPISDDLQLVRDCLEQFFLAEDTIDAYSEFLDADWLERVLAETKLLAGQGDEARWYALIDDPAYVETLTRRVELDFAPTQRMRFAALEPVSLELDVKNVPTLLVKVFRIDAFRYHVETQREVDASMELDGLVANLEQTFQYDDSPLRRMRRRFELPILQQSGTFVVEFIGNGTSSRAVIHKGHLRHAERTSAAGHVFTVFDEAGTLLRDASLWFGGRETRADERGEILLPFSTAPGEHTIVLRHGERSSLARFRHVAETYELSAPCHLDREALIAGARARLLVRPQLSLAGRPVALSLLGDPVLTLVATDLDGLATTQEVRDLELVDERELVHELGVPERLARISVSLRGSVRDLAGNTVELSTRSELFEINAIDATAKHASLQLVRNAGGHSLEMRGKDGEIKAGRPVPITLHAREFADPLQVTLQTDAAGRIELGPCPGIVAVQVPSGESLGTFHLRDSSIAYPKSLHGPTGTTLRVAYRSRESTLTRAAVSLLGEDRDAFGSLAQADGFLELRSLEPGDYELLLHESGTSIPVRITRGRAERGWLIGRERMLEATPNAPLQIARLGIEGQELRIQLANARASTRVAVVATRFAAPFELFASLRGAPALAPQALASEEAASTYHVGRTLGDEYRYVLERRFAPKFPGNMLRRPSLLLNPWELAESTSIGIGAGAGGRYGKGRAGGASSRAGGVRSDGVPHLGPHPGLFANLDYVPRPSTTLANLVPDASGLVRVPLADLGQGQLLHVLALDGDQAIYATFVRDEQGLQPRARHLGAALDPRSHAIEQRRIELIAAQSEAVLDEERAAEATLLDSLAAVHRLLLTISASEDLAEFEFVVRWPSLTREEQLELYERYACHELHFFLFKKDPQFFAEVVGPYLANKQHKTFLDHWLLGSDLRAYLEPWAFGRLNLIERILLAQRLDPSERASIQRLVREARDLEPPDRERIERLFDLALANDALAEAGPLATKTADQRPPERDKSDGPGGAQSPAASEAKDEDAEVALVEGERAEQEQLKALGYAGEPAAETTGADQELAKKLAEDAERRKQVRNFYRPVDPTQRLIEHDYWQRAFAMSGFALQSPQSNANGLQRADSDAALFADLVPPNAFWLDYANAPADKPFVSTAVAQASSSFLEMLFALSVLDLPFTAGAHELKTEATRRTLRAATPLLLVRKEIEPVAPAPTPPTLVLGENFLRQDDRTLFEDGEVREKYVTGEFLTDVAYAAQVLVTNPTASRRSITLLLQIPAGAVPVQRGFWTRGRTIELGPYSTQPVEYAFYFPAPGDFLHYPAHASEKGALVSSAAGRSLHVVATPTEIDSNSWEHVSQHGRSADVLAYLERTNVQHLDLARCAWRLRDREFFGALVARLRARHVYSDAIWSYGILHGDATATREYLDHASGFVAACGPVLDSPLLTIDPIERHILQHVELDPLVHARAHRRTRLNVATNADLAHQYRQFLDVLGYRTELDDGDWTMVAYHMLLQDRIEDALAAFAKIDPARLASKLQYDYLSAYLCFYTGDVHKARGLAEPYREHPVQHWRERFRDVLSQLDEAEGKQPIDGDRTAQDQLAASEPSLEIQAAGQSLQIRYRNLEQCEIRYYPLDVEIAFSAQPFAQADGDAAAFVEPILRQSLALASDTQELALELPPQFQRTNVLVEVRAAGITRSRTLFANALDVRFLESYGQVAVADPKTGKPLSSVYVKSFAKHPDGRVFFHKDGYTDLRGRFDYVSVSDDPDLEAQRFAVLVLSDELGAVVRELAPPAR